MSTFKKLTRKTLVAMLVASLTFTVAPTINIANAQQAVTLTSGADLLKIITAGNDGGEKALACKRLAIYGSPACVPEVAKLLSDKQLASWARITLEAVPGDASKAALREAATKLDGELLVGVINSIGVLRDAEAVELLTGKLKDGTPKLPQQPPMR